MTDLETGRQAAIRDLDATIGRLHMLEPEDWERQTPNEGWQVRHLAAHLVEATASANEHLETIVQGGQAQAVPISESEEVTASSRHASIVSALTLQRNALFHTLARLGPDDLAAPVDQSISGDTPMNGQALLSRIMMEFGLHRFDLEWALGEHYAGLSTETVVAIDEFYGSRLVSLGGEAGAQPPAPTGFHLEGALIDRAVTWDGHRWVEGIPPSTPIVRIFGDDSALALFLCGRIGIDDHRLEVEGDRDAAARFKTFVPGP
jgi:uncharacterized protein (TIGR03083 family)